MRRSLLAVSSSVLLVLTCAGGEAAAAAGDRVAIMDLNINGFSDDRAAALRSSLGSVLATEVTRLGHDVISTADINAMLSLDRQRALLGCDDDVACLAEIGGALGSTSMVAGSVSRVGDSIALSLSLVDTRRAEVRGRFEGVAGTEEALLATVRRGARVIFGVERDLSGTGVLFIKTQPEGATVAVDGKELGPSPVTLDGVLAGDHLIVARKDGLVARTTVTLAADSIERVELTLQQSPPVPLRIFSTPAEAEVFIDGDRMGTTPLVLKEVQPGERVIEVRLEHYRPAKAVVDLDYEAYERGGSVPVKHEVTLEPAPVGLSLSGVPAQATVRIDGREVEAPYRVVPGERVLTVEAKGHEPFERRVVAEVGRDVDVAVEMPVLAAYAEYLDETGRKALWTQVGLWTAVGLAAAGAGMIAWAEVGRSDVAAAYDAYHAATTQSEIDARYAEVAGLVGDSQLRSGIGYGLLAGAVAAGGFALFSLLVRPEDPTAQPQISAAVTHAGAELSVRLGW